MKASRVGLRLAALICSGAAISAPAGAAPINLTEGGSWTPAARAQFYTQDQGSEWMPLAWVKALKRADGQPFLSDQLARYGYLPNPASPAGLPVGFTAATRGGTNWFGMTCAACHTREIKVDGQDYRIDGGPALVDFQALLADTMGAVGRALATDASFAAFARDVYGRTPTPAELNSLKAQVTIWYGRESVLMNRALPTGGEGWGLGRLDAVGMIFNRLTGLDLGGLEGGVIPGNIHVADAPVRYPFLWNAAIQDKTQWPGFAPNGNNFFGLIRNVGEVYGVFGYFRPTKALGIYRLTSNNSANFAGLQALEGLVRKINPPRYPWPVNTALANQGAGVFVNNCASCHGIAKGEFRGFGVKTWATPVQAVDTDQRQYDILAWQADPGTMEGAHIPFVASPLANPSNASSILSMAVVGSVVRKLYGLPIVYAGTASTAAGKAVQNHKSFSDVKKAFIAEVPPSFAYESRVMQGIWAAAPYLHNGSVPTLEALLMPAAQRPAEFQVGNIYDKDKLGLAADQMNGGRYVRKTTGCEDKKSGNSRCGHEFGTNLMPAEKQALLEYLKTL